MDASAGLLRTLVLESCPRDAEEWKGRTFVALAKGCEENHGKPYRKYIKHLIANKATLEDDTLKAIAAFIVVACDKFDGAVARDVARKFGIIYAGGLFGVKSGLLPWTEAEVQDAILKSFRVARALLPDTGVALREGLELLRVARPQFLKVSTPPKKSDQKRDYGGLAGYRTSTGGDNFYRFGYEHYCRLFTSDEQRRLVTNRPMEKNHITMARPKMGSERRPQDQFVWPDGSGIRSIELVYKKKKAKSKMTAANPKVGS